MGLRIAILLQTSGKNYSAGDIGDLLLILGDGESTLSGKVFVNFKKMSEKVDSVEMFSGECLNSLTGLLGSSEEFVRGTNSFHAKL